MLVGVAVYRKTINFAAGHILLIQICLVRVLNCNLSTEKVMVFSRLLFGIRRREDVFLLGVLFVAVLIVTVAP